MKIHYWLLLASAVNPGAAFAQSAPYPLKTVRIIVPSSPGGGTDILSRRVAQKLSENLRQQFVVENRPGAGQMIGIETATHAAPDGYTLLMAASAIVINQVLYKKISYDTLRDLAPVTPGASLPNILVVHPALPVRSVRELVALAKTHSGQLNYSSAGNGTSPHMSMELFRTMAGITINHIPYKGTGPAGTPRDIVSKLQAETAKVLLLPEMKERLSADGAEPVGSRPDEFAAYIRTELA